MFSPTYSEIDRYRDIHPRTPSSSVSGSSPGPTSSEMHRMYDELELVRSRSTPLDELPRFDIELPLPVPTRVQPQGQSQLPEPEPVAGNCFNIIFAGKN